MQSQRKKCKTFENRRRHIGLSTGSEHRRHQYGTVRRRDYQPYGLDIHIILRFTLASIYFCFHRNQNNNLKFQWNIRNSWSVLSSKFVGLWVTGNFKRILRNSIIQHAYPGCLLWLLFMVFNIQAELNYFSAIKIDNSDFLPTQIS